MIIENENKSKNGKKGHIVLLARAHTHTHRAHIQLPELSSPKLFGNFCESVHFVHRSILIVCNTSTA